MFSDMVADMSGSDFGTTSNWTIGQDEFTNVPCIFTHQNSSLANAQIGADVSKQTAQIILTSAPFYPECDAIVSVGGVRWTVASEPVMIAPDVYKIKLVSENLKSVYTDGAIGNL